MWRCGMVIIGLVVVAGSVQAGGTADRMGGRVRSACDPVCELRSQDAAFSLLLETFRQFKSCRIEGSYQTRLQTVEQLPERKDSLVIASNTEAMRKLQEYVRSLARAERDLQMEELQTQVVNFEGAYKCVRRLDEVQLGTPVTNSVNLRDAARRLKDFVIVSQGSPATSDFANADPIPAEAVLLDAEPATPTQSRLIEPCE